MKTISVSSSKRDGDTLVIGDLSWPLRLLERLVGRYNPHFGWDYHLWSSVLLWISRRDRELVSVPIQHSCEVAAKLWSPTGLECWHHDDTEESP